MTVDELLKRIDAIPFEVYRDPDVRLWEHADEITIRMRALVSEYRSSTIQK